MHPEYYIYNYAQKYYTYIIFKNKFYYFLFIIFGSLQKTKTYVLT